MNNVILVLAVSIGITSVLSEQKYTTKYDNVNLETILNNRRLLKNYSNCLLDKGSCSLDGAEFKRVLPEVIETDCIKCSERQRSGSRVMLRHLIDKEPEIWKELEYKYDPEGIYRLRYKEQAEKEGIHL